MDKGSSIGPRGVDKEDTLRPIFSLLASASSVARAIAGAAGGLLAVVSISGVSGIDSFPSLLMVIDFSPEIHFLRAQRSYLLSAKDPCEFLSRARVATTGCEKRGWFPSSSQKKSHELTQMAAAGA
ncbi:MAG: hypothetical protein DMG81_07920 [Acidobacteria bacterium]|nr:MAG: hypothetical protein DMG81_07920 [Acidobacteriota bacterium]